jgi:hypothetical protein
MVAVPSHDAVTMRELSDAIGAAVDAPYGTAIAKLAKDDLQKMEHYLVRARQDYRDVLWWADIQEEEDRKKAALRGAQRYCCTAPKPFICLAYSKH